MVLAACHRNDGDSCQWMIAINTGMYITVGKTVSVSMGWNGREKHARMAASRTFEVSQREPEFRRQKTQKSNTYVVAHGPNRPARQICVRLDLFLQNEKIRYQNKDENKCS